MDILLLVASLAAAGALGGLIAGLLGVGGGIVVPVLFYLLPFADVPEAHRMHVAVATSLTTFFATSIVSARSHHRRGGVDVALLKSLLPGIFAGVLVGVTVGGLASGPTLTLAFAVVALMVAAYMAFFKRDPAGEGTLPTRP